MKIGVIMGGVSSEAEVSLNTGREMLKYLDRSKYEAVPVVIKEREDLVAGVKDLDFALLALHGAYGEDGTVQGTLETLGIPYSGSGVLASSLCMNKHLSKTILRASGVPTPDWVCWDSVDEYDAEAVERLGYPVMVKPNSGGSSIGMTKVYSGGELRNAVEKAFAEDASVLIERFTAGEEITCSILGGDLLPFLSIKPLTEGWFDYGAKYERGGADERIIELDGDIRHRVETAAMTCYKALKCSVYARIDMLILEGVPYVLEVNTLPGMTETSLLPQSARAAGYSFSGLLDRIIAESLKERGRAGQPDKLQGRTEGQEPELPNAERAGEAQMHASAESGGRERNTCEAGEEQMHASAKSAGRKRNTCEAGEEQTHASAESGGKKRNTCEAGEEQMHANAESGGRERNTCEAGEEQMDANAESGERKRNTCEAGEAQMHAHSTDWRQASVRAAGTAVIPAAAELGPDDRERQVNVHV